MLESDYRSDPIVMSTQQSALVQKSVSRWLPAVLAAFGFASSNAAPVSEPAIGVVPLPPFAVCQGRGGEVFLSEPKLMAVVGMDPRTGATRVVCAGGLLGVPAGLALDPRGAIIVANGQALVLLDPRTGAQRLLASGGLLKSPLGVTVTPDGTIYVADALGGVIRLEPGTAAQTPVASNRYFNRPHAIAVSGASIYVADVASPTASVGKGRIIHVDSATGRLRVLTEGQYLAGPTALAVEGSGALAVGDPNAPISVPGGLPEGSVVRVDPLSGAQNLLGPGFLAVGEYSTHAGILHQQLWAAYTTGMKATSQSRSGTAK